MNGFEPRSVCITGAAGFIGSNFVRRFVKRHRGRVVLLDALTYAGNLENLSEPLERENVTFVEANICDEPRIHELFSEHKIDTVVHFAAESHVDRSILGPDAFITTNVHGTHVLLKCARAAWTDPGIDYRFHHISTDEVFGSLEGNVSPATEETAYAPNSPYAASKAAADHIVRAYYRTYGTPVVTTNCSNNFGPFQFPEKLIPLAIVRALDGNPIPVYGDGEQIRDWLFVTDHCDAIETVLRSGKLGETYNISGRGDLTNLELLTILCSALDRVLLSDPSFKDRFPNSPVFVGGRSSDLWTKVADRAGHDRRYALDASKILCELHFKAAVELEHGIEQTVRWYLGHEGWWRRIMDGSYRNWVSTQYASLAHKA